MKLKDIYNSRCTELQANTFMAKKPVISFEIFPPKANDDMASSKIEALFKEIEILSMYNPAFISVTYGAGGSTQENTLDIVLRLKNELGITPMPHFTCVGSTRKAIKKYISIFQHNGIENILALRGDPPKGMTEFQKPEDGFGYANELIEFIKGNSNLSIVAAGYPEGHQQCTSIEQDIFNLKRKVDAGAEVIITQTFYDNMYFFDFLEKTQKAGIDIPIIPCILPITNFSMVERMTNLCGAKIPNSLVERLQKHQNDAKAMKQIGIEFAVYQCQQLIDADVPGLHFCTLNKSHVTCEILDNLSVEFICKK